MADSDSFFDRMVELQRTLDAARERSIRDFALRLTGEAGGDPVEIIRGMQARLRELYGQDAALVWCVVGQMALAPGVAHESYLAIDTGKEGTNPVRIGPVLRIASGMLEKTAEVSNG